MNPALGLPVDVSSAKSMPPEEVLFRDGLGDRLLVRDAEGRPSQESLVLRTELSSVPSFEFALNERLWLVERFDHPTFLIVRNVVRLPGRLPRISLISDYTGGTRLSDMLARAESNGQLISAGAAVFVIKEILEGLADLHRQSGDLSHGALAPERIVLAEGRVRIADYVLGAAIEQLRYLGRALLERIARGGAGLRRQCAPGSSRGRGAGRNDRHGVVREPPAPRFGAYDRASTRFWRAARSRCRFAAGS